MHQNHNLEILKEFDEIAKEQGLTMSDLAMAWTQAKYDNILSRIGTTSPEHFLSARKAMDTKLDDSIVAKIENLVSSDTIKGHTMHKWIFENGIGRMV